MFPWQESAGPRRCGARAALGAFLTLLPAAIAHAGAGTWTSNGPYGGQVTVIAVDPQTPTTAYAAGFSGVFKTGNGGASWTRASNGITDSSVAAIAVDPITPTTLYAGSIHGGPLMKSVDGANSWTPSGPTLVIALAINPQATGTIYAARQQAGLSKSVDGGATWSPIGAATLPSFPTFKSLVVDPATPSTVYAGEQSKGVWKSTDGGATWAAANTGFTGPVIQILGLAIDPKVPATLYAAASTTGGAGIYKSTNGGGSWTQAFADNSSIIGVQSVSVDPQNSANVYIGTFSAGAQRSTNGGTTFTAINTGLPKVGVNVVAVNPKSPASLYAGTQNGVFTSTTSGAGWTGASSGLALTTVTAVAVDPRTPTTLYAATTLSGLFKSTDGGGSWTAIDSGVPATGNLACSVPNYSSLVIDPVTPGTLYAGTQCTLNSQVLKSTNGGASWVAAAGGLPAFGNISALAVDPAVPSNIIAGTTNSGLFQSADGGAHWAASTGAPPTARITGVSFANALPPAQAGLEGTLTKAGAASVGVASTDGNGVQYSGDGGKTWAPLPVDADVAAACVEEYASLKARGAIYGVVEGGFATIFEIYLACLSVDSNDVQGDTIKLKFSSTTAAAAAAAGNLAHGTIIGEAVTATPQQVIPWGSPDGVRGRGAACAPTLSLVDSPTDASVFYGGSGCGVLRGANFGAQVTTMNAGLPANAQIRALAVTSDGTDLYAGVQSGGVYRYTVAAAAAPTVSVIEFYNAVLDHYFITWVADEIAKLDAGTVIKGWTRTGKSFPVYNTAQAGTSPVCRYYIPPGLGDSHFFGRGTAECNATGQKNPSFVLEDPAFMQVFLPTAGTCPANTTQVYRVFSNRPDANHRYMTDKTVRDQMVARGWLAEGDGPDLVVMCAPQ